MCQVQNRYIEYNEVQVHLRYLGTFEVYLVHRWYINVSSLYRFQAQKRYVIYSFIHVPILYQIGHISDIFGNPVQNRYTFFVPVKMYQFCTFFRCGIWPLCVTKHCRATT